MLYINCYELTKLPYSPGALANLIVPFNLLNLRTNAAILLIQEPIEGGVGPGRGEWPSGQKRQTVNLLKVFYVGSNPTSPTCCRLKRRESRRQRRRANRAKLFLFFGRAVK